MTLAGMVTSAVSILIVPVSSTVTGVLSASGRLTVLSLSVSFVDWSSFCDACVGADLRPDCAEIGELEAQTNPATNRIAIKQRANKLLFIITSSETTWERRHPYLLASVSRPSPEARKQRRLPSQGIFARLWRALTGRGETAGPVSFSIFNITFVIRHCAPRRLRQ